MKVRDGAPKEGGGPSGFIEKYHGEMDTTYWETLPDGERRDHWFYGSRIFGGTQVSFPPFNLSNIATTTEPFILRYSLQGRTDNFSMTPDHHTVVYLNGQPVDDDYWDGQREREIEIMSFPQAEPFLKSNDNILSIASMVDMNVGNGDSGFCIGETHSDKPCDAVFLNYFEIEYIKTYTAENDLLIFNNQTSPGYTLVGDVQFKISNMNTGNVEIYDITDPLNIYKIENFSYDSVAKTVRFSDNIQKKTRYIILSVSKRVNNIPAITLIQPSSLIDKTNSADYVIITHKDFIEAARLLAGHREGRGLKAMVVDIEDVYREFNYGIITPKAIKDFLQYAYQNWQSTPLYVLLLGDANIDYRDNWGYQNTNNDKNFIPVAMIQSATPGVGEIPSDNWFVTIRGDDPIPDMFIGRIPVKTNQEALDVVNKIISYETSPSDDWSRRVMLISGNSSGVYYPQYSNPDFVNLADDLATLLSVGFQPVKFYADNFGEAVTEFSTAIINGINDVALLVNFIGHGNINLWSATNEAIFTSDDASELSNHGRYPFVVALNCLNGMFPFPAEGLQDGFFVPLAENLIKGSDHGAFAVWTITGFGYAPEYTTISKELFNNLFRKKNLILGSATTQAKITAYSNFGVDQENMDLFILFGDPAASLNINGVVSNQDQPQQSDKGSEGGKCFIATAAYGSSLAPHVRILREFRDRILMKFTLGERIVGVYNRYSPPLAVLIEEHDSLKPIVRLILLPIIGLAWFTISGTITHIFIVLTLTGLILMVISLKIIKKI